MDMIYLFEDDGKYILSTWDDHGFQHIFVSHRLK